MEEIQMIKVKNGKVKIEGRAMDIALELTSLVECIVESFEKAGRKRGLPPHGHLQAVTGKGQIPQKACAARA